MLSVFLLQAFHSSSIDLMDVRSVHFLNSRPSNQSAGDLLVDVFSDIDAGVISHVPGTEDNFVRYQFSTICSINKILG